VKEEKKKNDVYSALAKLSNTSRGNLLFKRLTLTNPKNEKKTMKAAANRGEKKS